MTTRRSTSMMLAGALVSACLLSCGDVGNVSVKIDFADPAVEAATRRLLFVVREGKMTGDGNGCAALWSGNNEGLAESRSLIDFPNKNDVVVAPVMLAKYPKLTLLVYAHPSRDTTTSNPIAGGCEDVAVDPNATNDINIVMAKPPAR